MSFNDEDFTTHGFLHGPMKIIPKREINIVENSM